MTQMNLTKHAHACVSIEKNGKSLVVDAGTFTPNAEALLSNADAVLVTHDHFDHFELEATEAALDARVELKLFAPSSVVAKLKERPGQVVVVKAGDRFEVAGFNVTVFGEHHARIHDDIPQAINVAYLIDDRVYHPGDSYFVPGVPVELLLVPTSGPWTKLGEAVDFVRAIDPKQMVQIHELMLSEIGQQSSARLLGPNGLGKVPLTILAPGESIEI